jgi:hypothetical protein
MWGGPVGTVGVAVADFGIYPMECLIVAHFGPFSMRQASIKGKKTTTTTPRVVLRYILGIQWFSLTFAPNKMRRSLQAVVADQVCMA